MLGGEQVGDDLMNRGPITERPAGTQRTLLSSRRTPEASLPTPKTAKVEKVEGLDDWLFT